MAKSIRIRFTIRIGALNLFSAFNSPNACEATCLKAKAYKKGAMHKKVPIAIATFAHCEPFTIGSKTLEESKIKAIIKTEWMMI